MLALTLLALTETPIVACAAVINADPSNYAKAIARLAPGDTLQLASGTYSQGLSLGSMAGRPAQPITIRGPGDQSSVFLARSSCNTVRPNGTSYVQVLNLTLDGLGKDGPFGVDSRGNSHHITLENLKVVNHNGSQQTVGISTKGPAWNSRPTVVGLPTGNSRTIIRHNVFAKRSSTVGCDGARPNLLVGHSPLTGSGANDLYGIYANFFYQNPTEALFQGEGNISPHDNVPRRPPLLSIDKLLP